MTKDKRDVAFKSLAEEFFWLSNTALIVLKEIRIGADSV